MRRGTETQCPMSRRYIERQMEAVSHVAIAHMSSHSLCCLFLSHSMMSCRHLCHERLIACFSMPMFLIVVDID